MNCCGRKWKILENAVGVGALLGPYRKDTRCREGKSGVEDFSQFFVRVFGGDCLGVLGK